MDDWRGLKEGLKRLPVAVLTIGPVTSKPEFSVNKHRLATRANYDTMSNVLNFVQGIGENSYVSYFVLLIRQAIVHITRSIHYRRGERHR